MDMNVIETDTTTTEEANPLAAEIDGYCEAAMSALDAFTEHCRPDPAVDVSPEDLETRIGDLLSDLQHLAEREGLDPMMLMHDAERTYRREREGII